MKLIVVDASDDFYNATTQIKNSEGEMVSTMPLNKTVNPEEKRKIIGDTFMRIAQREIEKLNLDANDVYLGMSFASINL